MNTEFGRKGSGTSNLKNVLQPGDRLQNGKYILLEVFGQGPFTISYLARQTILGKKVIINEFFLLDHCSRSQSNEVINETISENIYRTFRQDWFGEAVLLSKFIGNEHFVTVLDTFEENNTAYYVTEYINEEDLHTFTLAQPGKHLDETKAIDLITQISTGLSSLHDNSIFHLHLSPIKVLIDKNGKAVIFSIGMSRNKIPVEVIPDVLVLTKAGYTSPELYHRDLPYGAFSDIYSVGAIMYFLLTGKDPLSAPERIHKTMAELKSINPAVTHRTNSAVMKAMAMDPEDRYQDLNDFVRELPHTSPKTSQANPKKLVLYSSVVLAIVAVIAVISYVTIRKFNHSEPVKQLSALISHKKGNHLEKLSRLAVNEDKMRGMTLLKDTAEHDSLVVGKYYALLIGIQNYKDSRYQKLSEPLNDVQSIYDVLVNSYTFDKNNVIISKDPDRKEVFRLLNSYRANLTPDDNLFVFYAGHGFYDNKSNMGYLVPSDADHSNDADLISYYDIKKKFETIAAKHILLIADACFAGSIFRGEEANPEDAIDEMTLGQLNKRSRTAFTSTFLKPVPDRSDFLKHLISNLSNNSSHFLLSEDLYITTRNSLIRSTSKKDPVRWGALQDCGDEGGDFIFIRRTHPPVQ
jgi:serine/threonine protein kinase